MRKIEVDAKGRKLGRLASEIAVILQGKDRPDYAPNKVADVRVVVMNASGLDVPENKLKQKEYESYTGYPGGLKTETMEKVVEKKGYGEVLKRAVYGMLPSNRLRDPMIKNLIIHE